MGVGRTCADRVSGRWDPASRPADPPPEDKDRPIDVLDAPQVLAVVVVRDGAAWLDACLSALAAQDHPALDVVAVDQGSSDASREVLLRHLGPDQVLAGDARLGFGRAVDMALVARPEPPLVLLVHDDLVLEPGAVSHLVDAIRRDPRLAMVGPKLVDEADQRLQSVGWTIDRTGRVVSGIEPGERDQGQQDVVARPLVVSTAGMLLRRDVYDDLGGFDPRFHLFRDDLDLCWRAWLAGWEVEVRPAAVGRHARAAANFARVETSPLHGARYYAERNTLAALLKNYGGARLALYLALFFAVGGAKVLGFLATRRVGDAAQTLRAWGWNLGSLRTTWRLRGEVQRVRRRGDADLAPKFSRLGPRFRAYGEAVADWLTGGYHEPVEAPLEVDEVAEPPVLRRRLVETLRRRPVQVGGLLLVVVGLLVTAPLFGTEVLRGGELAPFPQDAGLFFEDYVASWHDANGVGTDRPSSPAQIVLGLTQVLALGSAWAASRLVVIGAVPIAWLLSLRASRWLAPTKGPRVAAATLYVLSPPVLAAFRTGRLSGLVAAMALPGLAAALPYLVVRDVAQASAWRAAASAILLLGVLVSFVPSSLPVAAVVLVLLAAASWRWQGSWGAARVVAVAVGVAAVCFPWSLTWVGAGSPVTAATEVPGVTTSGLWRWVVLAPDAVGFPIAPAGIGLVVAAVFGVAVVARNRPWLGVGLWSVAMVGAVLAVAADRQGPEAWVWAGVPALVTALCYAALFAVGLRSVGTRLADYAFGWRQVGAAVMVVASVVGLGLTVVPAVLDPLDDYAQGSTALPAFLAAEAPAGGSRVLTLVADGGRVEWDLTAPAGDSLLGFGVAMPTPMREGVSAAIRDVVGGSDPGAAGRLGLFNISQVYVPAGGAAPLLTDALTAQLDLEPRPIEDGALYAVTGFVPRVSFAGPEAISTIRRRGAPAPGTPLIAFDPAGNARWVGTAPRSGSVLVSEVSSPGWRATTADGDVLERQTTAGLVRFDVPTTVASVEVVHDRQAARTAAVVAQLLAVLLVVSIVLRPPGSGLPETLR